MKLYNAIVRCDQTLQCWLHSLKPKPIYCNKIQATSTALPSLIFNRYISLDQSYAHRQIDYEHSWFQKFLALFIVFIYRSSPQSGTHFIIGIDQNTLKPTVSRKSKPKPKNKRKQGLQTGSTFKMKHNHIYFSENKLLHSSYKWNSPIIFITPSMKMILWPNQDFKTSTTISEQVDLQKWAPKL